LRNRTQFKAEKINEITSTVDQRKKNIREGEVEREGREKE
jgi:hypothetical protein